MLSAVGGIHILRCSTRAAASAIASPAAVSSAAAVPISLASAAPPSSSDSDEAAAALLAKPKPGGTGKKSAKGRTDGTGNPVPPAKNARTFTAMAPSPPLSDSDESAAPLAKPTKHGGAGKRPSERKGNDAMSTAAMQAKKTPPAKKAKTTTEEKVCPL